MSDSKFLNPVTYVLVYFNGTMNYRLTPSTEYVTLSSAQAAVREALSAQEAEIKKLQESLQMFADALPLDRDTVKTCYAVNNTMRDAAHAALTKEATNG